MNIEAIVVWNNWLVAKNANRYLIYAGAIVLFHAPAVTHLQSRTIPDNIVLIGRTGCATVHQYQLWTLNAIFTNGCEGGKDAAHSRSGSRSELEKNITKIFEKESDEKNIIIKIQGKIFWKKFKIHFLLKLLDILNNLFKLCLEFI